MKWIAERDALIAQTLAFVQSVTGRKDDRLPLEASAAAQGASAELVAVETVTIETIAVGSVEIEPPPALPPPQPVQVQPVQVQPAQVQPPRAGTDVRTEIQARIANFRKHQERFEREREEYYAETLTKLRAAIRDTSPRRPAGT